MKHSQAVDMHVQYVRSDAEGHLKLDCEIGVSFNIGMKEVLVVPVERGGGGGGGVWGGG